MSIRYVYPGSPADRGGLKPGMRIVAAGGVPTPNVEALSQKLGRTKPGDALEIVLDSKESPRSRWRWTPRRTASPPSWPPSP